MKRILRAVFSPILRPLESGDGPYRYKRSHRLILVIMSFMFILLASLALTLMPAGNWSYILPVIVFGGAGILGVIVGGLGTERAVARIWGSR